MPKRSISIRLNSETAKLYEEYREKWNLEEIPDSQIFRAGLALLMEMPDAVSSEDIDKLHKNQERIISEMKKRIQKNPDPRLYELWKELMENMDKIIDCLEKSAEKYSNIVGDGKAGRKPDPNKKHTPGRLRKSEIGFQT